MNKLLASYLQALYDENSAYWWGVHAILYVQNRWRSLKTQLREAWDSAFTWRMSMPVVSRIPIRLEVVQALTYAAFLFGAIYDEGRLDLWFRFGALLRFVFFGLLRPKELFGMCVNHVMVPKKGAHAFLTCAVASVLEPKNKSAGGRVQARIIRDRHAVAWISWLVADAAGSELLWPYGAAGFGRALQKTLRFIGLSEAGLTPSSFRAGGATALLEEGWSIAHIKFAGGWTTEKTLASYLQEAECAQVLLRLSTHQTEWLDRFLRAFSFLDSPPGVAFRVCRAPWIRSR